MSGTSTRSRALRIVLAGPGSNFKFGGRLFYSFTRRIANGFTRNGHLVVPFSDRDIADYALGIRAIGRKLANRRLVDVARVVRPDILCLEHAHLIDPDTIARIKSELPDCRVAVIDCDSPYSERAERSLRTALTHADAGFLTTGGRGLELFERHCPVAFIPNPVDFSIDNRLAYAEAVKISDVFYASGNSKGRESRWRVVDGLMGRLPHLRYALYGRDKGQGIWGAAHIDAIAGSKIGLNLSMVEGDLYASDRMAQYIGNGLLVACDRRSGFQDHFADDEMIFFEGEDELAERVASALAGDTKWRAMAEKGRRRASEIMSERLVCDFIVRTTMGQSPPAGWAFADQIRPAGVLQTTSIT